MHVDELLKEPFGLFFRQPEQGGRGGQAEILAGAQAEQAKGAGGRPRSAPVIEEGRVPHFEDRAQAAPAKVELIEAAGGRTQPAGQVTDSPVRPGGQPPARQPDGQREPRTDAEHLASRGRFGPNAFRAGDARE